MDEFIKNLPKIVRLIFIKINRIFHSLNLTGIACSFKWQLEQLDAQQAN